MYSLVSHEPHFLHSGRWKISAPQLPQKCVSATGTPQFLHKYVNEPPQLVQKEPVESGMKRGC